MLLQLADGGAQRLSAGAFLVHDFRRCAIHEAGVGELLLAAPQIFGVLFDFLRQPCGFGLRVDEARERNEKIRITQQAHRALRCDLAVLEYRDGLEAREAIQVNAATGEHAPISLGCILQQNRHSATGLDILLATHPAHGQHKTLHPIDVLDARLVDSPGIRYRVGFAHDGCTAATGDGRDALPDGLRNKRNHRVGKPQQGFQNSDERSAGASQGIRIGLLVIEYRLREFQIPGTILVPGELVECLSGEVESILLDGRSNVVLGDLQ